MQKSAFNLNISAPIKALVREHIPHPSRVVENALIAELRRRKIRLPASMGQAAKGCGK